MTLDLFLQERTTENAPVTLTDHDSEDGAFWAECFRSLGHRGLAGRQAGHLRPSSRPEKGHQRGVRGYLLAALPGSLHALDRVPKAWTDMVAAAIRTVFALPGATHVGAQLEEIARMLEAQFPDVSRLLVEARDDLLAFAAFPAAHWKKICSTNPLERLNGEIKRRTQVAGIFPNDAAVLRLITALIVDTHDEWQVAERRYLPEESMTAVAAVDRTGPEPLPESPLAVTA